jgi:hypothetical protein
LTKSTDIKTPKINITTLQNSVDELKKRAESVEAENVQCALYIEQRVFNLELKIEISRPFREQHYLLKHIKTIWAKFGRDYNKILKVVDRLKQLVSKPMGERNKTKL